MSSRPSHGAPGGRADGTNLLKQHHEKCSRPRSDEEREEPLAVLARPTGKLLFSRDKPKSLGPAFGGRTRRWWQCQPRSQNSLMAADNDDYGHLLGRLTATRLNFCLIQIGRTSNLAV